MTVQWFDAYSCEQQSILFNIKVADVQFRKVPSWQILHQRKNAGYEANDKVFIHAPWKKISWKQIHK